MSLGVGDPGNKLYLALVTDILIDVVCLPCSLIVRGYCGDQLSEIPAAYCFIAENLNRYQRPRISRKLEQIRKGNAIFRRKTGVRGNRFDFRDFHFPIERRGGFQRPTKQVSNISFQRDGKAIISPHFGNTCQIFQPKVYPFAIFQGDQDRLG